jgi:hypothetical protein
MTLAEADSRDAHTALRNEQAGYDRLGLKQPLPFVDGNDRKVNDWFWERQS